MRNEKQDKNLIPFEKGKSGNPTGRPRKMVSKLKDFGYNRQDIDTTILNMLAMTKEEVYDIYKNPNGNMLELMVASSMKKSLDKGNLDAFKELLNRALGTPKQAMDITSGDDTIKQVFIIGGTEIEL
jgi:hypothetical protein